MPEAISVQHAGPRAMRAGDLGDDVGRQLASREAPAQPEPERDGGVEVAARDVAERVGHGQHGQPEGERDAGEADAQTSGKPRRARRCRSRPTPARTFPPSPPQICARETFVSSLSRFCCRCPLAVRESAGVRHPAKKIGAHRAGATAPTGVLGSSSVPRLGPVLRRVSSTSASSWRSVAEPSRSPNARPCGRRPLPGTTGRLLTRTSSS